MSDTFQITMTRSSLRTLVKALHPDGIQDPLRRQLMDEAMKILNAALDAFKDASALDPFGDHPFADWVPPFGDDTVADWLDPLKETEEEGVEMRERGEWIW